VAENENTPLSKKLGIAEGCRIHTINAPENYLTLIQPTPESVQFLKRLTSDLDIIHFFTKSRTELETQLPRLISRIKQNGMIWVSWPKKASRVKTDVTEDVIRELALPLGIVDVKVCSVNNVWSGLKLVIRKENRW
jgi:hypothetical protein